MRRAIVAVVGATATGKTALGEVLADRLGGEVICADARQVFRELEIGTGKPTPAERATRPHHLFEWLTLEGRPTAGAWARAAAATCESCFERGVTPVLVGGSGLYVAALQQGLHPEPPRDAGLRAQLVSECEKHGVQSMHVRLASLDPDAARSIRPADRQRVLRALEVVIAGGQRLAWWRELARHAPVVATWHTFELTCAPAELARRIAARTRAMWDAGLVDEVRDIVAAGQEAALRRLAAIGYDEAMDVLEDALGEAEAIERVETRTRQLAKRQRTWFRHQQSAVSVDGTAGLPAESFLVSMLASILG